MKTDTFKDATLCSSDRTHLWLTWHLLPLSVTQNPPAKPVGCILTPVLCAWDSNMQGRKCCAVKTLTAANSPKAFLQKTSFKAAGISQNGCLKKAVCLSNAPYTFLLICMQNGGKKQLGFIFAPSARLQRWDTPTCWKWRIRHLFERGLSRKTRRTRWAGKGCRAGWVLAE